MPLPLDVGLRAGVLYAVLVLAIPIQYYMSNQMAVPSGQREVQMNRIISTFYSFKHKYLSVPSWKRWCVSLIKKVDSLRAGKIWTHMGDEEDMGESPARELRAARHPQGHFATSTKVRSMRPPGVKYRVGQVIRHKTWGYKGVIVGWDLEADAPERWINTMHPADKSHWRKMPNYSILVDTKDRSEAQTTYVPQENIEILTQTEINHPTLWEYFDIFDGAQYIMRKAIQYYYPKDQ